MVDVAPGLGPDFECGGVGAENAVRDEDVAAGAVFLRHGGGGLDHDGVVGAADDAAADDHVLAAVRVDAVVVRAALVVLDADTVDQHIPAARHVQGPEGGVTEGHALHGEVSHVLQKAHARTVAPHLQGAFVAAAVIVVLVEDLPPAAVDAAKAGDGHILRVPREEEAAALPAGVPVVVLKAAHEIGHVRRVKAGNELRSGFKMQFHVGFEQDRAGEKPPGGYAHPAAAGSGTGVDSALDDGGVERFAVSHGAEVGYDTGHDAGTSFWFWYFHFSKDRMTVQADKT